MPVYAEDEPTLSCEECWDNLVFALESDIQLIGAICADLAAQRYALAQNCLAITNNSWQLCKNQPAYLDSDADHTACKAAYNDLVAEKRANKAFCRFVICNSL